MEQWWLELLRQAPVAAALIYVWRMSSEERKQMRGERDATQVAFLQALREAEDRFERSLASQDRQVVEVANQAQAAIRENTRALGMMAGVIRMCPGAVVRNWEEKEPREV